MSESTTRSKRSLPPRRSSPAENEKHIRWTHRAAYVDTDQGGVVHHSAYVRWLETARIELLRNHGLTYKDLEDVHRLALPVVDVHIRYMRPVHYDEQVDIVCWVGNLKRASIRFDYVIERRGERLTEAEVTCACISYQDRKIRSIPELVVNAVRD